MYSIKGEDVKSIFPFNFFIVFRPNCKKTIYFFAAMQYNCVSLKKCQLFADFCMKVCLDRFRKIGYNFNEGFLPI